MFQAGKGLATRFVGALVRTGGGTLWVGRRVGGDGGHIVKLENEERNEGMRGMRGEIKLAGGRQVDK